MIFRKFAGDISRLSMHSYFIPSRRDSFITHRAFCDMLTKEGARAPPNQGEGLVDTDSDSDPKVQPVDSSSPTPPPAAAQAPAPAAPPPAAPQASDAISSSVSPVQTRGKKKKKKKTMIGYFNSILI